MLTEGVDETKTQSILCVKETTTLPEWQQINGRAARAHTERRPDGTIFDKTACTVIDMGASTYLHGAMDVFYHVQNYALRAPKAESEFSPWRKVASDPKTHAAVFALHNGQLTLFAVRPSANAPFTLLKKNEIRVGRSKAPARRLTRAAPGPITAADLAKIGRSLTRSSMAVITTLDSRPPAANLNAILKDSYRDSQSMIALYANAARSAAQAM